MYLSNTQKQWNEQKEMKDRLSKVWTFFAPSAELFFVYLPQTFSLVQQYLGKDRDEIQLIITASLSPSPDIV